MYCLAMEAWIGLGSNLGNAPDNLDRAVGHLHEERGIRVLEVSAYYLTEPWGEQDQEPFTNGVARLTTQFSAVKLLQRLMDIEELMGRTRQGRRWAPRTIDLDVLTWGDLELETPQLSVPHPRMHLRRFVLVPLLELDPTFEIPGLGAAAGFEAMLEGQKVSIIERQD